MTNRSASRSATDAAKGGTGRRARRIAFLAFLAVQAITPLWAIVSEDHVTRTDFTWDMFAVRRDCSYCQVDYVIGDGDRNRISWGLRAPALSIVGGEDAPRRLLSAPDVDMAGVGQLQRFEEYGRGALLAHPDMPAMNVRAAPQVARLKTQQRLIMIGGELCRELEDLYDDALGHSAPGAVPRWAWQDARAWRDADRRLSVFATCTCAYNGGEPLEVVDRDRDLCEVGR